MDLILMILSERSATYGVILWVWVGFFCLFYFFFLNLGLK